MWWSALPPDTNNNGGPSPRTSTASSVPSADSIVSIRVTVSRPARSPSWQTERPMAVAPYASSLRHDPDHPAVSTRAGMETDTSHSAAGTTRELVRSLSAPVTLMELVPTRADGATQPTPTDRMTQRPRPYDGSGVDVDHDWRRRWRPADPSLRRRPATRNRRLSTASSQSDTWLPRGPAARRCRQAPASRRPPITGIRRCQRSRHTRRWTRDRSVDMRAPVGARRSTVGSFTPTPGRRRSRSGGRAF